MKTPYRADVLPMPDRIAALPVDERGYPVPWFVAWRDGRPEFRAFDPDRRKRAIRERLCWVCGQPTGRHLVFVIGPMCVVNRITSEPPCHWDCADYSARSCPFLTRPQMTRRENDREGFEPAAGEMITRNPGVVALYFAASFLILADGKGGTLFQIGPAARVLWYKEGREANRAEVVQAIESGLPLLIEAEIAAGSPGGRLGREALQAEIDRLYKAALPLLPKV